MDAEVQIADSGFGTTHMDVKRPVNIDESDRSGSN
jgi:hypothetical protein